MWGVLTTKTKNPFLILQKKIKVYSWVWNSFKLHYRFFLLVSLKQKKILVFLKCVRKKKRVLGLIYCHKTDSSHLQTGQSKTCHEYDFLHYMFPKNVACQLLFWSPWWSLAKLLSGNPLVCDWPPPQTSPLICWKGNSLLTPSWSSWKMKPEQVIHFVVRADRKEHLVVKSSLWKRSFITLLLVQNFHI